MTDLKRKIFRSLSLLIIAASDLVFAQNPASMAAQPSDATQFVQELGNKAIAQLADTRLSVQEGQLRFRVLLDQYFDLVTIGKFTVGRGYWTNASPAQQQEFLSLYETRVTNLYAKRFQEYSGEQFTVTAQQGDGESDPVVSSQVSRPNGGPPVSVQWRVHSTSGGFRIVDVAIEGISMEVTDRQQFSAVIQRGGGNLQALIDALKAQNVSGVAKND